MHFTLIAPVTLKGTICIMTFTPRRLLFTLAAMPTFERFASRASSSCLPGFVYLSTCICLYERFATNDCAPPVPCLLVFQLGVAGFQSKGDNSSCGCQAIWGLQKERALCFVWHNLVPPRSLPQIYLQTGLRNQTYIRLFLKPANSTEPSPDPESKPNNFWVWAKVLLAILVLLAFTDGVVLDQRYSMLEFFAGKGNVCNEFRKTSQHQVGSFEINDCKSMDFLSEGGFAQLGF